MDQSGPCQLREVVEIRVVNEVFEWIRLKKGIVSGLKKQKEPEDHAEDRTDPDSLLMQV